MNSIQYIVVRKDLVPIMGVGKTAAQVAHASLGAIIERDVKTVYEQIQGPLFPISVPVKTDKVHLIETEDTLNWLRGRFTKVVIYVKTKQKLLNLAKKLDNDGIRHKLIYDACHTMLEPEESNGTTLTCMGIIPISRDNIPKYLSKLQLLE